MGDFAIRADTGKNRLYIRLEGFFTGTESERIWAELDSALSALRPGFDVITDLTGFKPGFPAVARNLRQAAELIKARGRRRAVRVAGRLITGLLQYKRELQGVFDEDTTRYATSVEDAERILDEWA